MTILQVAGEDESWDILNGSVDTNVAKYRVAYARCSIHSASEDGVQIIFRGALKTYLDAQAAGDKDFWFGYRFNGGGGFTSGAIGLKLYDSTDKCFMRLKSYTSGNSVLETSTNGTFGGVGDTFNAYPASAFDQGAPAGNPIEYTFRVKIHPTLGQIVWYLNGAFWFATPIGNTTALCTGSPKLLRFGCPNSNSLSNYSEFIATSADQPRVNMNLNTLIPTADGAHVGWAGGFASIAEVTEDTSTLLQTAAAATISTFVASDMTALTGSIAILAIVLSGKFAAAVGAPQNVAGILRIAAADYSAALQTVAAVNELRQFIWSASPATTVRFTEAEVDAFEYGIQSAA